jgi:hypothetical protein
LNPIVSWHTTWKKRVSTTLSANYSFSEVTNFLSDTGQIRTVTNSDTRGGKVSLSYTFSAPKGVKIPFLKRLKFSSDLKLTWNVDYAHTNRSATSWGVDSLGRPVADTIPHQRDDKWSTRLAASYSFSRTIEAGANVGYSYTKGLTGYATKTTDLDIWVLFRF